ncbi:hypothetical protein YC2023_060932 [Brassica napus]
MSQLWSFGVSHSSTLSLSICCEGIGSRPPSDAACIVICLPPTAISSVIFSWSLRQFFEPSNGSLLKLRYDRTGLLFTSQLRLSLQYHPEQYDNLRHGCRRISVMEMNTDEVMCRLCHRRRIFSAAYEKRHSEINQKGTQQRLLLSTPGCVDVIDVDGSCVDVVVVDMRAGGQVRCDVTALDRGCVDMIGVDGNCMDVVAVNM